MRELCRSAATKGTTRRSLLARRLEAGARSQRHRSPEQGEWRRARLVQRAAAATSSRDKEVACGPKTLEAGWGVVPAGWKSARRRTKDWMRMDGLQVGKRGRRTAGSGQRQERAADGGQRRVAIDCKCRVPLRCVASRCCAVELCCAALCCERGSGSCDAVLRHET